MGDPEIAGKERGEMVKWTLFFVSFFGTLSPVSIVNDPRGYPLSFRK